MSHRSDKKLFQRQANEFIEVIHRENLHLNPDLRKGDFCDLLGLSLMQMHHMFKRNFGRSYTDVINSLRVEHGKKLLAELPIDDTDKQELALQCGYRSVSGFYKNFKKHVGINPLDYQYVASQYEEVTGRPLDSFSAKELLIRWYKETREGQKY